MSIALSLQLPASPLVRLAWLILGAALALAAFDLLQVPHNAWRLWAGLACAVAALATAVHAARRKLRWQLEISASGQIHLAKLMSPAGTAPNAPRQMQEAQLLPGSSCWPWLLALRLRTADGKCHRLLLTPEACSAHDWRCLLVAIRWLMQTARS